MRAHESSVLVGHFGEFGPDLAPVFGSEVSAGYSSAGRSFDLHAADRWHGPITRSPLAQERGWDAHCLCKLGLGPVFFGEEFREVHALKFSDTLNLVNSESRIPAVSRSLNNSGMQLIEQIYRNRLKMLASEAGSQRALAERIGKSPAQISQWINGSKDSKTGRPRSMDRNTAREIERLFPKPEGWMDQPLDEAGASEPLGVTGSQTARSAGVAHSMSLYEITVPPTTKWEDLMTLGEVPEHFTVAMPDDALAGFIERGTGLIFERSDSAAPGKTVLVEDKDGNRFIRRYAQVRGDHWRAIATSEVFGSLDSLEHGLRVLAVMRWREG